MWQRLAKAVFGFVLLARVGVVEAGQVTVDVDLSGPTAPKAWVLARPEGVAFRDGELVLDGVTHHAPCVVLREPVLGDMTMTCKVYVEPKGGARAYEVRFHSTDSVSDQYVHVNRGSAILCWAKLEKGWNELVRVGLKRPEGKWLDVKVECEGPDIRFFMDGKRVLSGTGGPYKAGRVGFSTSQGLVRVKDIRIEGTAAKLAKPWRVVPRPKRFGTFHELPPKYRHTDVSGKLDITVSKPFIISSRITRPEMGRHEQPHLFRMQNGDIILVFHKDGDIHGAIRVILKSTDKGKTWTPFPTPIVRLESVGVLRDGTVLFYDDYAFRKEGNVFVGQMCVSKDGGKTFGPLELAEFHRPDNITPAKAATYWGAKDLAKYQTTSAKWSADLCHAMWRTVLERKDGTLIASAVTRYKGDKLPRVICYKSTDKGRTWGAESVVAGGATYAHEPVMSWCSNGDVLCIMRHALYQARSTDGGKTWGPQKDLEGRGVDPDMCLLSNGVLACSYGRPGNRIMFSADGTGKEWTDRLKVYEYTGGSFGYTGICEAEPGKLLMVYDRHDAYPEYGGKRTTAIQGVYITVSKP